MGMFNRRAKAVQLNRLDELQSMMQSGKPVLLDFFQFGCGPCKVMDGVINELAEEYAGSAHVVKVNVQRVPGAVQAFGIRSTPTFVLLGQAPPKRSKKKRQAPVSDGGKITPRWRGTGLVKKDFLARQLESSGASRVE